MFGYYGCVESDVCSSFEWWMIGGGIFLAAVLVISAMCCCCNHRTRRENRALSFELMSRQFQSDTERLNPSGTPGRIQSTCPGCSTLLDFPVEAIGGQVECGVCGVGFPLS